MPFSGLASRHVNSTDALFGAVSDSAGDAASGKGDLWFNTYGAMFCVNVSGSYVVDTGHIVAFTDGLQYEIGRVGGYKSLFFSGEGLVCRFSGKGTVWCQSHNARGFGEALGPDLKPR